MLFLGINVDHVATLRQARYRNTTGAVPEPDPVTAAHQCIAAGAHSITVHLREDCRHIQEHDVRKLKETLSVPLNLEMAVTDKMIDFALQLKPEEVCLVPEKREELTTEGGLDVCHHEERIHIAVQSLQAVGIKVSLFVDTEPRQIEAVARTEAACLELHTGVFANAQTAAERAECLKHLREAAIQAHHAGLQVNAGHGLNYHNLIEFLQTPHLHTLNIGHSIISRSITTGLKSAVHDMLVLMKAYHG